MHIHPIRFGIHLQFMDLRKEFHPRLCRKFWDISPLQWFWIFYVLPDNAIPHKSKEKHPVGELPGVSRGV